MTIDEQKQYIAKNYMRLNNQQMADAIGVSRDTVKNRIRSMELHRKENMHAEKIRNHQQFPDYIRERMGFPEHDSCIERSM